MRITVTQPSIRLEGGTDSVSYNSITKVEVMESDSELCIWTFEDTIMHEALSPYDESWPTPSRTITYTTPMTIRIEPQKY